MNQLVLSLFPGADLLGMAFEEEGFTVVRGPDALLGGDIRKWHMVPGHVNGVIGGPPCKTFSKACKGQVATEGNLIPEFVRVVKEAQPQWFVMENVPQAPVPEIATFNQVYEAWDFGAHQHRKRRFSSNLALELLPLPESQRFKDPWPTVTATEYKYSGSPRDKRRAGRKVGRRMTIPEVNVAMGLPEDWDSPALTVASCFTIRGNGVPLQLGRALAKAVKASLGL